MNVRRVAILDGAKYYSGRCSKNPTHHYRWTGSGACMDCYPRRRGTLVTAMTALYGSDTGITLAYARATGLPLFREICNAQGHNSWRYVKTPHICLQCADLARRRRAAAAPPAAAKPAKKKAPVRNWYFVVDLRSGLIVSHIGYSNAIAAQLRREIKRDHPSMLPIVTVRKQTPRALREIKALPMLRLDRYPETPDWPANIII